MYSKVAENCKESQEKNFVQLYIYIVRYYVLQLIMIDYYNFYAYVLYNEILIQHYCE